MSKLGIVTLVEIVKSLIENISDEVSGVLFASIGVIHSHTRAEVEPK